MKLINLVCPRCGAIMATNDGEHFSCNNLKHEPYETTVQEQLFKVIDLYMQQREQREHEDNR